MKVNVKYIVLLVALIALNGLPALAQHKLDRKTIQLTRQGNKAYEKGDFKTSEEKYQLALTQSADYFKAKYNLANNMFKEKRYKEAAESYQSLLDAAPNKKLKAEVYHNLGNSLLMQKNIDGSIKAYENSLLLNPKDQETRYNLSYALKLKQQQKKNKKNKNKKNKKNQDKKNQDKKNQDKKNQDKKNQDKKNQDKKNQDKKNQDKKNQDKKNQDKKNQDKKNQDKKNQDKKNQDKKNQDKKNQDKNNKNSQADNKKRIGKKETQRLLKAMAEKEKATKAKVDKRKVKVSSVKVEKDW